MNSTNASSPTAAPQQWSPQQQSIFSWFKSGRGSLVVRARAGTGKTTTILEALRYAPEKRILLAAFNKRIAEELAKKLNNPRAEAKTLHGVGYRFVRQQWQACGLEDDRGMRLAKMAVARPGTNYAPLPVARLVKNLASKAKGCCPRATLKDLMDLAVEWDLLPEDRQEEEGFTLQRVAEAARDVMQAALRPNVGAPPSVDFDDMLYVPVMNGWVRGFYDLVVVDEAQDMNYVQLLLAQQVVKPGGRMVVVGDDRQAIYGFRGADSQSLDRLKKELGAEELPLTTTYRCPKKVVALAAQLVPDYQAAPQAPEGVVRATLEEKFISEAQAEDFVLSRQNAPLVKHCLAMLKTGKRARIEGRDIGRGLLALVRRLKAQDLVDLQGKLKGWLEHEQKKVLAAKGGDEDAAAPKCEELADMAGTVRALSEGLLSVAELEMRIETLFADTGAGQVIFSSVHKAKGLEAKRVFLLEESFMRRSRDRQTGEMGPAQMSQASEEVNIRYVAITRSKGELVWVKKCLPPEEVQPS